MPHHVRTPPLHQLGNQFQLCRQDDLVQVVAFDDVLPGTAAQVGEASGCASAAISRGLKKSARKAQRER